MTDDTLGEIRVWEVPSGKLLSVLAGRKDIRSGSFSADGLTLASGDLTTARLWNLRTRRELMSFDDARAIEFSPDGQDIARMGKDEALYLAHLPTLHEIDSPQPQQPLAKLLEAAKRSVGVFEPVTAGSDESNATRTAANLDQDNEP